MSILRDVARLFRREPVKEKVVRSPQYQSYEQLRAKSVSPVGAQRVVKEALADVISMRAARERSQEDFEDVVAKIRERDLARKITKDFRNRTV